MHRECKLFLLILFTDTSDHESKICLLLESLEQMGRWQEKQDPVVSWEQDVLQKQGIRVDRYSKDSKILTTELL